MSACGYAVEMRGHHPFINTNTWDPHPFPNQILKYRHVTALYNVTFFNSHSVNRFQNSNKKIIKILSKSVSIIFKKTPLIILIVFPLHASRRVCLRHESHTSRHPRVIRTYVQTFIRQTSRKDDILVQGLSDTLYILV